jgi:hypothetical protein
MPADAADLALALRSRFHGQERVHSAYEIVGTARFESLQRAGSS